MLPAERERTTEARLELLAQHWFELWKASALALFSEPAAAELELRALRRRWFTELARFVDDSMRAPLFLEVMTYGFKALNQSGVMSIPQTLASRTEGAPARDRSP